MWKSAEGLIAWVSWVCLCFCDGPADKSLNTLGISITRVLCISSPAASFFCTCRCQIPSSLSYETSYYKSCSLFFSWHPHTCQQWKLQYPALLCWECEQWGQFRGWRFSWKLCRTHWAKHLWDTDLQATSFSLSTCKTCQTRETEWEFWYKYGWSQVFPHAELWVKALPNYLSSELTVFCWAAGSAHHPCAEHPGMDSSQCMWYWMYKWVWVLCRIWQSLQGSFWRC